MSIAQLLTGLADLNVKLWRDNDRLRYRAPKGVMTNSLLDQIAAHKPELLSLLVCSENAKVFLYPVSHNQRALWLLHKLAPESAAYNVGFALRIRSGIKMISLQKALQRVLDRHAVLRTTFSEIEGEPFQRIHSHLKPHLESFDVSGQNIEAVTVMVTDQYRRPLNLEVGPPVRVCLFNRSRDDQIMLLVAHHITLDAWSFWILLEEFSEQLGAEKSGTHISRPAPELEYSDFVRFQKRILESDEGARMRSYWKEQLAGYIPQLNLPTDRPRPLVRAYQGASHQFFFDQEFSTKLKGFADAEGVTMYVLFLAAYQVLLSRLTAQDIIMVCSPASGRNRSTFAGIVGLFINRIILRANLAHNQTIRELLAETRQTLLAALEHQDYPFQLLVEELNPTRDSSSFFQVTFNFLKAQRGSTFLNLLMRSPTAQRVQLGEIEVEPFDITQQEGQADISLVMGEAYEAFYGSFKYDVSLFDEPTVAKIAQQFETLLLSIIAQPDCHIARLPMVADDERARLISQWNSVALW